LDTTPPIFYLNDISRAIIRLVEELNRVAKKTVAAYTFDAGPNAVIYYLEEHEAWIIALLKTCFEGVPGLEKAPMKKEKKHATVTVKDTGDSGSQVKGMLRDANGFPTPVQQHVLPDDFDVWLIKGVLDGVSRIIWTGIGEGPEKVTEKSLVDEQTGMPKMHGT